MKKKNIDTLKPESGFKNKHGISYTKCQGCGAYVKNDYLNEHQCDGLMSMLYGAYLKKHENQTL